MFAVRPQVMVVWRGPERRHSTVRPARQLRQRHRHRSAVISTHPSGIGCTSRGLPFTMGNTPSPTPGLAGAKMHAHGLHAHASGTSAAGG